MKNCICILRQTDTEYGQIEVWQLLKSKYAIIYNDKIKTDLRWRVIEVYIKDGQIRTRGDLPYKDYNFYTDALKHIEYNANIENEMEESS